MENSWTTEIIPILGPITEGLISRSHKDLVNAINRLEDVSNTAPKEIVFIINSFGGTFSDELQVLIKLIQACRFETRSTIMNAGSATAMIASATNKREIFASGEFCFHDGTTTITALDVDIETRALNYGMFLLLQNMRLLNRDLIEKMGVVLPNNLALEFSATQLLKLTPKQCLKLGIVSRII